MATAIPSPIKRHGGKKFLAKRIIELMPPRCKNPNNPAPNDTGWLHYVEPYAGSLAVLFANDPEGIGEVVNDLDGDLTNFWSVLRCWSSFVQFQQMCEATPCSESVYREANERLCREPVSGSLPGSSVDRVERAWAFFTVNRQSRQALGRDFATLARSRTRRGMNELPSAWLSAVEGLPEVHERLKRVVVLNRNALDVIRQQDGPRTLVYADPPYCHETRATTGEYAHEMTSQDHSELLGTLSAISGRFMLSGYRCDLYDDYAKRLGWRRVDIEIDNKASGKKTKDKKVECIWMNY